MLGEKPDTSRITGSPTDKSHIGKDRWTTFLACLFYADMEREEDRWADERTSRVWIQGDLHAEIHAENFGTYMDGDGVFVFDVNDFDEAYLGHFTWDIKRMVASVALLAWMKAISDADIAQLIETYVRAYIRAGALLRRFRPGPRVLAAAGDNGR